jgi:hypothetical protein
MPKPTLTSRGRDFDNFLHAVIRDETDGPALTVLSVLARQNVDPWETAQNLAHLPRDAAVAQLRPLIAAPGKDHLTPEDNALLIALITRLPRSSMGPLLSRNCISATRTRIKKLLDSIWSDQGRRSRTDKNEEP